MFEEKFQKVGNINISYISEGSGKPILFIHGLSGYKENWEFSIPFFSKNYNAIAIDLPGFGNSDKPVTDYTIDFYSEVIKDFLEELRIEKTVLVGNSMGGQISLLFALKYPQKLEKLVLADAAGINPEGAQNPLPLDPKAMSQPKGLSPAIVKMIMRMLFYKQSEVSEKLVERAILDMKREDYPASFNALLSSASNIFETDLTESIKDIIIPTLIVWGEKDRLLSQKYAQIFNEKIKKSKLALIGECGHVPMLEKPDEFNKAVDNFIRHE